MFKPIIFLVTVGCLFAAAAATSSIGFVRSAGDFRVDGSVVRGNSTVFDGNVIETSAARSVVQLDGSQLTLAPDSRAKVYRDRTILEKGTGTLREANQHFFQADTLQISPGAKDSVVQVDVVSASRISVFAVSGSAQVRNSTGILVASIRPGMALAFDAAPPQSGGSTAVKMTGTVNVIDGKYFITDATANVTAELRGSDLAKLAGKTVEITGSIIPNATATAPAKTQIKIWMATRQGATVRSGNNICGQ